MNQASQSGTQVETNSEVMNLSLGAPMETQSQAMPSSGTQSQATSIPTDQPSTAESQDAIIPSDALAEIADRPSEASRVDSTSQAKDLAAEDAGARDDRMLDVPAGRPDASSDSEHVEALSLPLAKIRRIMQMDPAYVGVSRGAVYATGLATELFIQHLTEQASLMAKVDRRKKILYKDFSTAVDHHDAFAFLSDTIPKTQILSDLVKNNKVALSTDPLPREPDFSIDSGNILREPPVPFAAAKKKENQKPVPAPAVLPKGQQTLAFAQKAASSILGPSVLTDLVDNEAQLNPVDVVDVDVEMHDANAPSAAS